MTKDPLPSAGGSYRRDAKGKLLKVGIDKAKPAKPQKTAKSGGTNTPVKEA